jgi:TATA-box binding protein (TBP) (component of TFIID and TFIIIB)
MVVVKSVKICNFKVHLRTKHSFPARTCFCDHRHNRNYCKIRNKFYYTIFPSGFINITGIRKKQEIEEAINQIISHLQLTLADLKLQENGSVYCIDNITVTGALNITKKLNLAVLHCKTITDCKTSYNNLHFPGLFLHFTGVKGTVLLFSSGKFNIVGLTCSKEIPRLLYKVIVFIQQSQRTGMKVL